MLRRKLVRGALYAAYAGLLLAVLGATSYLSFSRFVRRGAIATPDLGALSREEATGVVESLGLRVRHRAEEDRFDDTVAAGKVLQQNPAAGSFVKQGGQVEIILSRGQQLVEVPALLGQALQAAQTELAAAGLLVGRRGQVYWPGGEPGTVVHQSPPAGELILQASEVDLLVAASESSATFVMPDLVYRRASEVRQFFEGRGFRFGSVKFEPYEGVEEGTVLRHTPLAGYPLHRRDPITLVVATSTDS